MYFLDIVLEMIDTLENQPGGLTDWVATPYMLRLYLHSLPMQVSFNVVHHLHWPAESLLYCHACTKENTLGLLTDKGIWL